jgi:hypothetical protein
LQQLTLWEVAVPRAVYTNITGKKFGHLTVVEYAGRTPWKRTLWRCLCDCGMESTVQAIHLTAGHTKSCGCRKGKLAHGHARNEKRSPTYQSWQCMHQRCNNPKQSEYRHYGGRGITVCERWYSFELFLADMGERPPKLTLDRIDNEQGYYPANCKWETRSQQNRNKRKYKQKPRVHGSGSP